MNYNARLLAKDIYQKKPELTIEPGYFVDMIPQYTIIVKQLDGKDFKDVRIFSKNDTSEQTTIYADSGNLKSDGNIITINLKSGEIHEIDLTDYDYYRKIKFDTHQIIISLDDLILNRTSESNRTDREMRVPQMLEEIQKNRVFINAIYKRIDDIKDNLDIEKTPSDLISIVSEIEKLKLKKSKEISKNKNQIADGMEINEEIIGLNNTSRQLQNEFTILNNYKKTNNKFRVEIHKKFTLAVACILFTLVGAPLGILVKRGGITIASALSITFFLIYYILLIWGEQLADRNLLNPGIGSWLPNIILFISGLIILKQSNKKN